MDRTHAHANRWTQLAETAWKGLQAAYATENGMPHTMLWNGRAARAVGLNVRYALISLLGLEKVRVFMPKSADLAASLWNRVESRFSEVCGSAGDLGLGMWAQALSGKRGRFSGALALRVFQTMRGRLDSVHLAWLLLGCDHVLFHDEDAECLELAHLARQDLLALYNPDSRLFFRHPGAGLVRGVARRISCFANQIYPVMALAVHGRRCGCKPSAQIGRAVAENLCALQGPLGQWWWLYDARHGTVVDGYPVFSVHQDGMAPMALLETTNAGGRTLGMEIEKGLGWIFGRNELRANLVVDEQGLILRDIHKRGVGRVRRAMNSAIWCLGWQGQKGSGGKARRFVVNQECRPYHLGWVLYTASLMFEMESGPQAPHCSTAGPVGTM